MNNDMLMKHVQLTIKTVGDIFNHSRIAKQNFAIDMARWSWVFTER